MAGCSAGLTWQAMAQTKPASSRAMAVATTTLFLRADKLFETFVQSLLRFPGDEPHFLALFFLPFLHGLAHQRFQTVMPRRFGQHAPTMGIAAFGDAALHPFSRCWCVRSGVSPKKCMSERGSSKRLKIPGFGHQGHAGEHLHAAQAHERAHDRLPLPAGQRILHGLGQTRHSFGGVIDGMDVFLENDLLRRLRHEQAREVTFVRHRSNWSFRCNGNPDAAENLSTGCAPGVGHARRLCGRGSDREWLRPPGPAREWP